MRKNMNRLPFPAIARRLCCLNISNLVMNQFVLSRRKRCLIMRGVLIIRKNQDKLTVSAVCKKEAIKQGHAIKQQNTLAFTLVFSLIFFFKLVDRNNIDSK